MTKLTHKFCFGIKMHQLIRLAALTMAEYNLSKIKASACRTHAIICSFVLFCFFSNLKDLYTSGHL